MGAIETLPGVIGQAREVAVFTAGDDPRRQMFAEYWMGHGFWEGAEFWNITERHQEIVPSGSTVFDIFGGYVLHDIGKVSGRYQPEEWLNGGMTADQKKAHVVDGIAALAMYERVFGVNLPLAYYEIINTHHERPNGTGYSGLTADQIGQIGLLAGVLDPMITMCQPRQYNGNGRKLHSFETALAELNSERDTKYPGEILDMLAELHRGDPRISELGLGWIDVRTNPNLWNISREFVNLNMNTLGVQ